jgi:hypothetical protein
MPATLPNFLVIGAMKSGTSSLTAYLASHPDVFVCEPREPDFFSTNTHRGLSWYESLFREAVGCRAIGESSTGYTKAPAIGGVPERIAAVLPSVRLIYLIRNPVDRIRSMYVHEVARSRETRDLRQAIKRRADYFDLTRYGYQLDQYLSVFPREQILIVRAEDLLVHRRETVARVFEFIGVDANYRVNGLEIEHNTSGEQRGYRPPFRRMSGVVRTLKAATIVPASARNRMRPVLAGPLARPEVSEEVAEEIWAALRDDLQRLRQIAGPDVDLWGRA